jgi:hypothetical protein
VVFANDNESNCGIKIKLIACLCRFVGDGEEAEVGEIIRNTKTTRNAGDGHTPDVAEFFVNNSLEFTFGDAILRETYVKSERHTGRETRNN